MSAGEPRDVRTTALEWNDLAVILAIGRAGSLSGAARSLGQTHSTVFRRINAIEERTGVRFFDRFPSGYVATEAGETAMGYGERVEGEFHALGLEVLGRDQALRGRIRLTCMDTFAAEFAPGIVASFCARHPEIQIDLTPGIGAADLSRREAEVAVRATRNAPETAFGRRICDFRFALFASPAYLAAAANTPLHERRWCMIEGFAGWLVPHVFKSKDEAERHAVFQCSATRPVLNAVAAGMGMTLLPCYAGDADPRVVRASGTFDHLDLELWVLTHPDLRGTARVRALMSHIEDDLRTLADLFCGLRVSGADVEAS